MRTKLALIEYSPAFQQALSLLHESQKLLFITGKAGTGKSTLLSLYLQETVDQNIVVLAPTGVAALNVQGMTIHSFFGFKPGISIEEAREKGKKNKKKALYRNIDQILIDEVSMVRADLLDCIDVFLKEVLTPSLPFGGIKIALFGDLYQLPPVCTGEEQAYFRTVYASPYFFSAKVFETLSFQIVELDHIYRQTDPLFIEILNAMRQNQLSSNHLEQLNQRTCSCPDTEEGLVYLTATNKLADQINEEKLSKLSTSLHSFQASVEGEFDSRLTPTDLALQLKVGAQVMFLTNHPLGLWVNGTTGKVKKIQDTEIWVETENKTTVSVKKHNWPLYRYSFDSIQQTLEKEEIGSFEQYPLRLAWGLTIHKSQGKTFDRILVDWGYGMFAHGQAYVALSRARRLEGIFLKKPLRRQDLIFDPKVLQFFQEKKNPSQDKISTFVSE